MLLEAWESAPLGWDPSDAYPVADVICFLFSDQSRKVTGQTLSVDGGHHLRRGPDFEPAARAFFGDDAVAGLVPPHGSD